MRVAVDLRPPRMGTLAREMYDSHDAAVVHAECLLCEMQHLGDRRGEAMARQELRRAMERFAARSFERLQRKRNASCNSLVVRSPAFRLPRRVHARRTQRGRTQKSSSDGDGDGDGDPPRRLVTSATGTKLVVAHG
jgi:hypothetical protein